MGYNTENAVDLSFIKLISHDKQTKNAMQM